MSYIFTGILSRVSVDLILIHSFLLCILAKIENIRKLLSKVWKYPKILGKYVKLGTSHLKLEQFNVYHIKPLRTASVSWVPDAESLNSLQYISYLLLTLKQVSLEEMADVVHFLLSAREYYHMMPCDTSWLLNQENHLDWADMCWC